LKAEVLIAVFVMRYVWLRTSPRGTALRPVHHTYFDLPFLDPSDHEL